MSERTLPAARSDRTGTAVWRVVATQELRELWLSGKGLTILLVYTLLLSISTYVIASNQELNFLEQREAVSLTLKLAVVVGSLLAVLVAADAVSGERERGTLEALLLTPAPRRSILLGKGIAAVSLWLAAFAVAVPYLWWIGRDVDAFATAVTGGFGVGTLLALSMTGLGLVVSTFAQSNGLSLAVSLFVLLAFVAPSQMPAEASRGWAGETLQRLDPFTAGLTYLERLVINAHSLTQDLPLMAAPVLVAVALPALALLLGGRLALLPRGGS